MRRKEEGRRKQDTLHKKSNNPNLKGGEQKKGPPRLVQASAQVTDELSTGARVTEVVQ